MLPLLNGLLRWLGILSAWLTGLMVLTTVLIVILRYVFGTGAIALQESVVYAHAIVIALGLAYTLQVDEHVRVDLFYSRLSNQARNLIDLVGHILLLLPVSATLFYLSLDYVEASWRIREASPEVGGLPAVFLLKTLIPVSAALLFLQGLGLIATGIARLRTAAPQ
ncbi:MAG: TRAP transporter small permease subunit [Pseudomonadota bacterium]